MKQHYVFLSFFLFLLGKSHRTPQHIRARHRAVTHVQGCLELSAIYYLAVKKSDLTTLNLTDGRFVRSPCGFLKDLPFHIFPVNCFLNGHVN